MRIVRPIDIPSVATAGRRDAAEIRSRNREAGSLTDSALHVDGAEISGLLGQILVIQGDGNERRRKVVRLFLSWSLARKFGSGVISDPALIRIVDLVHEFMKRDIELQQKMNNIAETLIEKSGSIGKP